ncbi:MAG TPA: O-antigen ligase family protein [Candidatus Dormibacteraeota bacterium]
MSGLLERLGGYCPAAIALALPTLFIPTAVGFPSVVDSYILPRASLVLGGALLATGLALLLPRGPGLGMLRLPLAMAAGAALLAFIFSISWPASLAGSYTRYESLPMRLGYLGLLASAVWLLRSSRARETVVPAFVFGVTVASIEALLQWAGKAPFRPDGNLGNANLFAGLVVLAVPLAVARGLRPGPFVVAWWLALPILVGGLLVSTSRSGYLALLAGCLALAVFEVRRRFAIHRAIVAGSAAVSALALAAAMLAIALGPLNRLNDDPASLRLHLWQDGLRMIAARPLTGWGEDTTGLAFGRFLSHDYASLVTFDRVHSGPLDLAATEGLLGLAALTWVLVVVMTGAWRARFPGDAAALLAALVAFSVWVSFNFDWAPATGAFWLLAGTAWAWVRAPEAAEVRAAEGPAASHAPGWGRSAVALACAVAALPMAVFPVVADSWYYQGRADLSVRVDPLQARYHWSLGEALVANGSVSRGIDEMRLAADYGETEPGLYVELGDAESRVGDSARARQDYRRALEIDPYYTPASQHLAALKG